MKIVYCSKEDRGKYEADALMVMPFLPKGIDFVFENVHLGYSEAVVEADIQFDKWLKKVIQDGFRQG